MKRHKTATLIVAALVLVLIGGAAAFGIRSYLHARRYGSRG